MPSGNAASFTAGVLLAALTPYPVQAEVATDAPPLDARVIEPHTASFEIAHIDADGTRVSGGRWTDEVTISDGKLVRTVVRYSPQGEADLKRTIVADSVTLKPELLDQRFGPGLAGVMHVDFDGHRVHQLLIRQPNQSAVTIDAQFDRDVWELSLWGTLAMSLPFETGSEYMIPTIAPDRRSVRDVTFRIEGVEEIDLGGRILTAAKVVVPEEHWVFWVRKQAPYIVRIEHPAPGGLTAVSTLAPAN